MTVYFPTYVWVLTKRQDSKYALLPWWVEACEVYLDGTSIVRESLAAFALRRDAEIYLRHIQEATWLNP